MDYAGYYTLYPGIEAEGKRWTTAEIFEEVKYVIDQLIVVETEKGGADK